MSSYRNIHFSFQGKLKTAYLYYLLVPLLLVGVLAGLAQIPQFFDGGYAPLGIRIALVVGFIVTLTIAIVFAQWSRYHYLFNGLSLGQSAFSAEVRFSGFSKILFKILGLLILLLSAFATLGMLILMVFGPPQIQDIALLQSLPGATVIAYVLFLVVGVLFYSLFTVKVRAYLFEKLSLEGIRFSSNLRVRKLFWLTFSNLVFTVLSLGIFHAWAVIRRQRCFLETIELDASSLERFIERKEQGSGGILAENISDVFDIDIFGGIGV